MCVCSLYQTSLEIAYFKYGLIFLNTLVGLQKFICVNNLKFYCFGVFP